MTTIELRQTEEARTFLLQSLWLQRVLPVQAVRTPEILTWALELAGSGELLPPLGFLADVGHLVYAHEHDLTPRSDRTPLQGWFVNLLRTYEDYVLGKLYCDASFSRGADALRPYQGRDRSRGLAFLLTQFRGRAGYGGVLLSPAVIKGLQDLPVEEILKQGWISLERGGLLSSLRMLTEELVREFHQLGAVLGLEDLIELERGTALKQFSQRIALRQVLQAASHLEQALPLQQHRPASRRREAATKLHDEDAYPVGGYSSLSTRGSIESLLHSQLALMERDERPDLFDVKFLRDELLYYARDENQFWRRRRTFLFVLDVDLPQARFKDPAAPFQRLTLGLALLYVLMGKLLGWLSNEALHFEFLLLQPARGDPPLAPEKELLGMLFAEQINNGTVAVVPMQSEHLARRWQEHTRRSECQVLHLHTGSRPLEIPEMEIAELTLAGPRPKLKAAMPLPERGDAPPVMQAWADAAQDLLQNWV